MTKIDSMKGHSLHILLLKCEGYKFPRNPNSNILEQFCETKFYGPLAVSLNSREPPYELSEFRPSLLHNIEKYNQTNNKYQPAPMSPITPAMGPTIVGIKPKMWGAGTGAHKTNLPNGSLEQCMQLMDANMFYMYRYKTAMCPQSNFQHDWNSCCYAHRPTDYRYLEIYI